MAQPTTAPASPAAGLPSGGARSGNAGGRTSTDGEHLQRAAAWLVDALGVELPADLLRLALTHRSYAYEHGGLPTNERLEFLGDSVLGLVVTDELYRSHPDLPEGQLAKLRASVVNMTSLARVSRALGEGGIGPHLLLGRGEQATGGREKDSILADALEALLGAVHLGRGLDTASAIVHRLFDPLLAESATRGAGLDWKTSLQELGASLGLGAPVYDVADEGPDHAKTFTADVLLAGQVRGSGRGRTKKAAEQEAAEAAWRALSADAAATADGGPTAG
ncbi:ribonuclease III [Modestobacter sp. L9-4]|uniref:ribonuclease III n=1 Tax=Modestobacter sp. L9-4 TaxID=2851567 RepID=UPI001F0302AF|nr:ribonuclease III [Modestobacter sp. L9-4]